MVFILTDSVPRRAPAPACSPGRSHLGRARATRDGGHGFIDPLRRNIQWNTARIRCGELGSARTPSRSSSFEKSAAVMYFGSMSKNTMFVSTPVRSTLTCGETGDPVREPARLLVILAETLDMMVQRIQRGRGEHARLAHRPPNIFLKRATRAIVFASPHTADPAGDPRPFEKQQETVSKWAAYSRG